MVSFATTLSLFSIASLATSFVIPGFGEGRKTTTTSVLKAHTTTSKKWGPTTTKKWGPTTTSKKWGPTTTTTSKKWGPTTTSKKWRPTTTKKWGPTTTKKQRSSKRPSKPTGHPGWGHHWNKTSVIVTSGYASTFSIPAEETTLIFSLSDVITEDATSTSTTSKSTKTKTTEKWVFTPTPTRGGHH